MTKECVKEPKQLQKQHKTEQNKQQTQETQQESKVVQVAYVAKALLKKGYQITDIKPDRTNKDRTVFVFNKSEELLREIKEIELQNELSKMNK